MTRSSVGPNMSSDLSPRVVVVAVSLGGLRTLESMLGPIPREFPAPIVVAHHLAETQPSQLAELLSSRTELVVRWARHLEVLKAGHVYIGPPGKHISLSPYGRCRLSNRPRYNFVRPAGDLLFRSAAEQLGPQAIAVVLSGRLRDGASGAQAIRAAGGVVIAQDPATCAATGMPNAAIDTGSVHFVLPPQVIGAALVSLTMVPGATDLFGVGAGSRTRAA